LPAHPRARGRGHGLVLARRREVTERALLEAGDRRLEVAAGNAGEEVEARLLESVYERRSRDAGRGGRRAHFRVSPPEPRRGPTLPGNPRKWQRAFDARRDRRSLLARVND